MEACSILIDNLTLQSVAFLACAQYDDLLKDAGFQGGLDLIYNEAGFKPLALDLIGLSNFVQATVLHDKVYYIEKYASSWHKLTEMNPTLLDDLVHPFKHSGLPDKDPWIFGHSDKTNREIHHRLSEASMQILSTVDESLVRELQLMGKGYEFNYGRHREGERCSVQTLHITPCRDKEVSVVLLRGALYFEAISKKWNIPIIIHPIRSALLWDSFGRNVLSEKSSAQIQFGLAEQIVKKKVSLNVDSLPMSIQFLTPALLSRIINLSDSRAPSLTPLLDDGPSIVETILELREQKDVVAYRKHTRHMDEVIALGDIGEIRKFVQETEALAETISRNLCGGGKLKLKVGFGGISSENELTLPEWATKPYGKRQAFLYSAIAGMKSVRSLANWSKKKFKFDPEENLVNLMRRFEKLQ